MSYLSDLLYDSSRRPIPRISAAAIVFQVTWDQNSHTIYSILTLVISSSRLSLNVSRWFLRAKGCFSLGCQKSKISNASWYYTTSIHHRRSSTCKSSHEIVYSLGEREVPRCSIGPTVSRDTSTIVSSMPQAAKRQYNTPWPAMSGRRANITVICLSNRSLKSSHISWQ